MLSCVLRHYYCTIDVSLSMQIMLLEKLNVYVTSTQEGMLKLWSADTLKPVRAIQNGNGGKFHISPVFLPCRMYYWAMVYAYWSTFRISCSPFFDAFDIGFLHIPCQNAYRYVDIV